MKSNKIIVLSGAGMSQESGIKTFRDSDGLWEGHDIMQVASPEGWRQNPNLVLDFYNQRRKQLLEVSPNNGHLLLAEMQHFFDIKIITQNVDDLHERAGSNNVLHLHGELLKVRSSKDETKIYNWKEDLHIGDLDHDGNQLRPHIVWFGEEVPKISEAIQLVSKADIIIIVGTSLQVYPAASLVDYCSDNCKIYYIDLNPINVKNLSRAVKVIKSTASEGLTEIFKELHSF